MDRHTQRWGADSATVHVSAAMALGDTADPAALDPLAEVLDDPSTDLRLQAIQSWPSSAEATAALARGAACSLRTGHY
ncbi:hypothetical protein ACQB60_10015 [Actinomycetota bacterium Odt1-20B]